MRDVISKKMFVMGMDAADPRFMKRMLKKGLMPNTQKFIDAGSCREDLVLLGGHPTVTPPMWTTLATGCYANVHGITDFYAKGTAIDTLKYGLDSRMCKAEPLWNVFAEQGAKTMVWHWPGCGWPPTSDSPNLAVVDGSSPGVVGLGVAGIEFEFFIGASEEIQNVTFIQSASGDAGTACYITGLDAEELDVYDGVGANFNDHSGNDLRNLIIDHKNDGTYGYMVNQKAHIAQTPIKPAKGWADAPEDAKELTVLLSKGLIRRPALVLKNEDGVYDKVAIYKSKKESQPIVVLPVGVVVSNIIDDCIVGDEHHTVNRSMKLMEMAPDGSRARIWVSGALDIDEIRHVCHPKSLYDELVAKFGYPPASANYGVHEADEVLGLMLEEWKVNSDWTANCLNYLMEEKGYDVVFSHYHMIDLVAHHVIQMMCDKGDNKYSEDVYIGFMEELYMELDRYIGKYLHLLDEGWTVFLVSDHGQVCSKNELLAYGDPNGVSVQMFEELGLTVLKRDENGNRLREIDWEKTVAVAQRGPYIYLNLKGRSDHGIIDPQDQYEVEEEIITKLYGYRSKKTGKRVISVALRNKDAIHFGLGGPDSGDIIAFAAEGYDFDHGDSISTTYGEQDTSVSPMFIAAGTGIKQGYTTERVIRQIDLAPTMAVLGGVRMPAQCEGAPVYQILENEF